MIYFLRARAQNRVPVHHSRTSCLFGSNTPLRSSVDVV